jgi:predicted transcriptional regulator
MDQLIDVATWVSLIAALLGISLAIVAIWFTFSTEARSRRINEQMIQSLQKIEGFVERSSADTQGLIKVGWDRMLGNVGTPSPRTTTDSTDDSAIRQIAQGLAEEMRAQLDTTKGAISESIDEDRIVQRVSEAIQAQLEVSQRQSRPTLSDQVESWTNVLSALSPTAYELAKFIGVYRREHLTRGEYGKLIGVNANYASAVRELRRAGVLVPLTGPSVPKKDQPVYWLPPGESQALLAAFELASGGGGRSERQDVIRALTDIGYLKPSDAPIRKSPTREPREIPPGSNHAINSDSSPDQDSSDDG